MDQAVPGNHSIQQSSDLLNRGSNLPWLALTRLSRDRSHSQVTSDYKRGDTRMARKLQAEFMWDCLSAFVLGPVCCGQYLQILFSIFLPVVNAVALGDAFIPSWTTRNLSGWINWKSQL
jgi:hypothetical protein